MYDNEWVLDLDDDLFFSDDADVEEDVNDGVDSI